MRYYPIIKNICKMFSFSYSFKIRRKSTSIFFSLDVNSVARESSRTLRISISPHLIHLNELVTRFRFRLRMSTSTRPEDLYFGEAQDIISFYLCVTSLMFTQISVELSSIWLLNCSLERDTIVELTGMTYHTLFQRSFRNEFIFLMILFGCKVGFRCPRF